MYGDDRCAAGHRLDHAVAEGLVEIDEVQQGVSAASTVGSSPDGVDRAEVADRARRRGAARPRAEVLLVLDDAGDVEPTSGSPGDLDRVGRALVGMDPPEVQQVFAGSGVDGEGVGVDAVVDGGGVVQTRGGGRRR